MEALLRSIFGEKARIERRGEDFVVSGGVVRQTEDVSGTVWCSKTVIRNHSGVLEYIRDHPVPVGHAREWLRHGYVIAIDLHDGPVHTVLQTDIFAR